MQIRLDKYLADMGVGTRSQVKQYIRRQQVAVNGERPKGPEQKVTPGTDAVSFQGREIAYTEYEYFLFYKPTGCVSAVSDPCHKTVLDYFPHNRRKGLFPVGRLDIDTEGLLLITNDGALSHNLLSPGKHVPKTYYAELASPITEADIVEFSQGIDIGEAKPTLPAKLACLPDQGWPGAWVELTITEGKFHQVKRMFEAVGNQVLSLKRVSMGTLKLDASLKPGEYRPLTETELQRINCRG